MQGFKALLKYAKTDDSLVVRPDITDWLELLSRIETNELFKGDFYDTQGVDMREYKYSNDFLEFAKDATLFKDKQNSGLKTDVAGRVFSCARKMKFKLNERFKDGDILDLKGFDYQPGIKQKFMSEIKKIRDNNVNFPVDYVSFRDLSDLLEYIVILAFDLDVMLEDILRIVDYDARASSMAQKKVSILLGLDSVADALREDANAMYCSIVNVLQYIFYLVPHVNSVVYGVVSEDYSYETICFDAYRKYKECMCDE